MDWLTLALLTALLDSGKDFLGKKLSLATPPTLLALGLVLFSLPFLWPMLFFTGIPATSSRFWLALAASSVLNALATWLYARAMTRADLSLIAPLSGLTPVLLLITSPLMVGEVPAMTGMAGVVLVAVGVWSLQGGGRPLWAQSGVRAMVAATLIWGFTSNFDKIAIREADPTFYAILIMTLQLPLLMAVAIWEKHSPKTLLQLPLAGLGLLGLVMAAMVAANMAAFAGGMVPYVIAIKRLSILVGVFLGVFWFGEQGRRQRMTGALLMLAGLALVVWSGE